MLPFTLEYWDNPDRAPWHEAAHIVVALCLGMRVVATGLAWTQGENQIPNPTTWVWVDGVPVEDQAAQLFAGAIGEVLKLGNYNAVTIGSDLRKLEKLNIEEDAPVERATAILKENDALFTRIAEILKVRYATPTRDFIKDPDMQRQVMLDEFDLLDLKNGRPLSDRKNCLMNCMPSNLVGQDGTTKHTEPSGEWFGDTPTVSFEACKNHLQALKDGKTLYVLVGKPERDPRQ